MKRNLTITIVICLFCVFNTWNSFAQDAKKDLGYIDFHVGTLIVYNTYTIGYKGPSLIKSGTKHQLRPIISFGGWKSTFFENNRGSLASLGLTYWYGKEKHFFEFSSELVFHFDKGLKGQSLVSTGVLYRPFIGYRYAPSSKRLTAKVGVGWYELFQFGLGFKL